ncbi:MAG TPA: Hsp20/alpha crystallin family protein [Stellaceae bacterium]|nr:Hsp20/alpha crystallin family protein [Stellaceae bacterium]
MAEIAVKSSKESVPSARPAGGRAPAPWEAWDALRDQMDRMFNTFMRGFPSLPSFRPSLDFEPSFRFDTSFGMAVPAVDVVEKDDAFVVSAELPGLDEKNLEVEVSGDVLTIKGEKREEKEEKGKNTYLSERRYGSFQRSFGLPDSVERGKIAARFEKGVLKVTLPKTSEAVTQQKKIPIASK